MDTAELIAANPAYNPLSAFYFNPLYLFHAVQAYGAEGVTVGILYEGDSWLPLVDLACRYDVSRSDTRRSLLSMDLAAMRARGWLRVLRKQGNANVYVVGELKEALPWQPPS